MWLRSLGLAVTLGVLAGCGVGWTVDAEERREIEAVLSAYAEAMAQAYAIEDTTGISDLATGRERLRLTRSIAELAAEGKALRPTLRSLVVESVERAGNVAVAANTVEVWDLRVIARGSDQQLSESLAQENRLSYSLIREDGRWLVLSRQLRTSTEGS